MDEESGKECKEVLTKESECNALMGTKMNAEKESIDELCVGMQKGNREEHKEEMQMGNAMRALLRMQMQFAKGNSLECKSNSNANCAAEGECIQIESKRGT